MTLRFFFAFCVLAAVASPLHAADTLFVSAIAEPGGDGQSWNAPFRGLDAALAQAVEGDEIWIARGAYPIDAAGTVLPKGVALYGGFVGNEDLREERDWFRRPTVVALDTRWTILEHDSTTRIDGLTFQGTNGGIDVQFGQPAFYNCRFTGIDGDALVLSQTGRVRVEWCQFDHLGGRGIAVRGHQDTPDYGWGPYIGECLFLACSTQATGGAVYVGTSEAEPVVQIASCVFDSNYAALGGGAVAAESPIYIVNSTFVRNGAGEDAPVGKGLTLLVSGADVKNSIFWNGDIPFDGTDKHVIVIKRSDDHELISTANLVEQDFDLGFWQSDPAFENIDDPLGADGYFGTDDDGLALSSFSFVRDGGVIDGFVNHQPWDAIGNPRLVGRKIDLGAYETQRSGRLSPTEVMERLRDGGYVLMFRHAKTDWGSQDPGPSPECFPGRNLIHEGREQSRHMGAAMRRNGITVVDAPSSPVCRCWETNELMVGFYTKAQHWASGGEANVPGRMNDLQSIPQGGIRVISTHDAVCQYTFNSDGSGEIVTTAEFMEGDCLVVHPKGDDHEVVAQWCSALWERYNVRFPDATVSVQEEREMAGGFGVYPNPAEGHVVIDTHRPETVTILDLMGRPVWSGTVDGPRSIEIGELAAGMYVVRTARGASQLLNVR